MAKLVIATRPQVHVITQSVSAEKATAPKSLKRPSKGFRSLNPDEKRMPCGPPVTSCAAREFTVMRKISAAEIVTIAR